MIKRYGTDGVTPLPLATAVRAGDFVFVSGQAALCAKVGVCISGNIVEQTELTIERLLNVMKEAGCEPKDVVKATVWLNDARDFGAFNTVYKKYFGAHPPARSCLVSPLVVDGKVEIELTAYKPLDK